MDGTVLQGVLIDKAIEIVFQLARDFGRSTGTRAIHQARCALAGKAMDPLAQGGIRKLEGVGNGLEALPCDDLAHGLGTAEDARLFGLFQEGV
jgi:hypothetical protein